MDGVCSRQSLEKHRVHLLVLLLALLAALTVAHPELLTTDELVTANQLAQLHNGHQIITSEGKYGTFENGTSYAYMEYKHNYLAYPLFLPAISIPALETITFFGENFVFLILYIWTFLLILLALLIRALFPGHAFIGRWQWTDCLIILAFMLFFINLFYYLPFSVSGKNGFPEVMAIVLTNCILFSLLAVMAYDILLLILDDPSYSFFGAMICLTSSSYIFWTSCCKDHILVAFLTTAIILATVRFWKLHDTRHLYAAFALSGLLAWARPELALGVFGSLCILILYFHYNKINRYFTNKYALIASPVFTCIGAIPFLLNNYLITGSPFILTWTLWDRATIQNSAIISSAGVPLSTQHEFVQVLATRIQTGTTLQISTLPQDIYGILFNPQSGSIGVFPIVPLLLVSLFLMPILIGIQKTRFTHQEQQTTFILGILSLGVFFSYIWVINLMNTDPGVVPDIRYISPAYIPLNIIALIILKKTDLIKTDVITMLKGMAIVWLAAIPVTLIIIARYYPPLEDWTTIFPPLNTGISLMIYILTALFLIAYLGMVFFRLPRTIPILFLILLCSIPLIWQIGATFLGRLYGTGLGGYSFWIPIVRMIYAGLF